MKLTALLLLIAPLTSDAVTRTWDGAGGTFLFSTAANWIPEGVPANGDDLVFPATAPNVVSNDLPSRTYGSLNFTTGTTIIGSPFTVTGGISTSAVGARGTVDINVNVTLAANQTFTCGGTGALRFAGSVSFGARTLTVTGASSCVFNALTGSTTAGSRLIKTGTGTLRLTGSAIAFSALPWDVSAGTLDVDGNLQAAVNLTGGKLTGDGTITGLNATGGEIEPDAGDLQISGPVTLGGEARCLFHITGPGAENTLECSGGSVTIQDSATMTVNAVNYTPVWDEDFQLITKSTAGAVSGTFIGLAEGAATQINNLNYRVSYAGGDGNDVTLTRLASSSVVPKLNSIAFSRGTGTGGQDQVTLGGTAEAFQTLTLEASSNLTAWTAVQPVSASADGNISVTVSQVAGQAKRFFRLRP
jgi:fibronectin-binding autotransporter adhesin